MIKKDKPKINRCHACNKILPPNAIACPFCKAVVINKEKEKK